MEVSFFVVAFFCPNPNWTESGLFAQGLTSGFPGEVSREGYHYDVQSIYIGQKQRFRI